MTGLESFDTTLQKTNLWLKDIMQELNTDDRHRAFLALRAVLHTIRDRLLPAEAAELGAQMPMLIRGLYYEGWHPGGKPVRERHKEQFLAHIREYFKSEPEIDAERVLRAVLNVMEQRISQGEIEDIKHLLPEELRALWPELVSR